jgi:hypothetical protein
VATCVADCASAVSQTSGGAPCWARYVLWSATICWYSAGVWVCAGVLLMDVAQFSIIASRCSIVKWGAFGGTKVSTASRQGEHGMQQEAESSDRTSATLAYCLQPLDFDSAQLCGVSGGRIPQYRCWNQKVAMSYAQ